jgi:hypothetical protein
MTCLLKPTEGGLLLLPSQGKLRFDLCKVLLHLIPVLLEVSRFSFQLLRVYWGRLQRADVLEDGVAGDLLFQLWVCDLVPFDVLLKLLETT